jgi:hypothetical protein
LASEFKTRRKETKFCMRKLLVNAEIKGKYSKIPERYMNRITKTAFILMIGLYNFKGKIRFLSTAYLSLINCLVPEYRGGHW